MTAKEAIRYLKQIVNGTRIVEYRRALSLAIAALREQEKRRWIPVTERLPERENDYICRCCLGEDDCSFYAILGYYLFDEKPHFQDEWELGLRVTHWMPIPRCTHQADQDAEPPKEDDYAKMQ